MSDVYLIATLDTKGHEAAYLRDRLISQGVTVKVIDVSCQGDPLFDADVPRDLVYEAAGESRAKLAENGDRGKAITAAADGIARLIDEHFRQGVVSGVISIGGSAGTTIGTAAMRQLPLGVPKLMVSTLASGQVRPYVGDKDILMMNSVVDIAGVNRIGRSILSNAAAAIVGMVGLPKDTVDSQKEKKIIAATMFGVTTPAVTFAREIFEREGFEVLVFHATGNGGQAMESLIRDGMIDGVFDLTTTELADEQVGGVLSAGPTRLTAAAECGIPQVVSTGAVDMVNFGPLDSIPNQFRDRQFYEHNPTVTLMRTTPSENRQLGEEIVSKLSKAKGPTTLYLPRQGVSAIDQDGQPFDDVNARTALFDAIREQPSQVDVVELDLHINDEAFATAMAMRLLEMVGTSSSDDSRPS